MLDFVFIIIPFFVILVTDKNNIYYTHMCVLAFKFLIVIICHTKVICNSQNLIRESIQIHKNRNIFFLMR